MRNSLLLAGLFFFSLIFGPSALMAQDGKEDQNGRGFQPGWSTFSRGGAVYQFDTDLDDGGSYSSTRFNIQAGHGYAWDPRTSVSLALGYSYDDFSFSKGRGFGMAALDPWDSIHSFRLSVPMRLGVDENWSAFLIPSVRSSGESGASFDDTITGGAFAGFAYRFGERLTLGPGIGIIGQLEDSATVFPVIIIDWQITDRISLTTGRGLAATLGPGVTLNYRASQMWNFAIGGRYEKLHFRLDKDGAVRSGIGEEKSFPLFVGCSYSFNPKATVSLVGGVEFDGKLRLEDEDGNRIRKESYDPGGYLGFTFNMRF